jgi:hypothetical protein
METLEKIAEKNLINYIELNKNHEVEVETNQGYIRYSAKGAIGKMEITDIVFTIIYEKAESEAGIFHKRDTKVWDKAFNREFKKEIKLIKSLN